jgi:hypothetical protein
MRAGVFAVAVSMMVGSSMLAADKAGYALLDKMVAQFDQLAAGSGATGEEISKALNEMMALAKKAQAEKRIDETFYRRYTRVLLVMRLVVIDHKEDPERILLPLAERELAAFVKDVTGAEADNKTLPTELSKAIVQEVDGLKRYLDAR